MYENYSVYGNVRNPICSWNGIELAKVRDGIEGRGMNKKRMILCNGEHRGSKFAPQLKLADLFEVTEAETTNLCTKMRESMPLKLVRHSSQITGVLWSWCMQVLRIKRSENRRLSKNTWKGRCGSSRVRWKSHARFLEGGKGVIPSCYSTLHDAHQQHFIKQLYLPSWEVFS